ncbi:hypothetical protein V1478_008437 [Vespula squamosa]|uniref:Uncharacterized protein n=1 Tax=Vespula squamosa TaxID=30214 RepID=A0ABD2ATH9_VESSQ
MAVGKVEKERGGGGNDGGGGGGGDGCSLAPDFWCKTIPMEVHDGNDDNDNDNDDNDNDNDNDNNDDDDNEDEDDECRWVTHRDLPGPSVRIRAAAETVKSLVVVANTISAKPQIQA